MQRTAVRYVLSCFPLSSFFSPISVFPVPYTRRTYLSYVSTLRRYAKSIYSNTSIREHLKGTVNSCTEHRAVCSTCCIISLLEGSATWVALE